MDAYNVFHYLFYEGNVDIFRSVGRRLARRERPAVELEGAGDTPSGV